MNVNDCHTVEDSSDETVRILGDLIESSRSDEQMVYRETELDELWRLLIAEQSIADPALAEQISAKIDLVMEVHDMVALPASDAIGPAAAARLRTLVA